MGYGSYSVSKSSKRYCVIKEPQFDVIVIGGGIAGISAGAGLAETQRVLVPGLLPVTLG